MQLVGADAGEVMVSAGGGVLDRVNVGVIGTLATFHDVAEGGTLDDTTAIAVVDTGALGTRFSGPVVFSKGLTVVTTGVGTNITVSFSGRATVSSRQFGAN